MTYVCIFVVVIGRCACICLQRNEKETEIDQNAFMLVNFCSLGCI